MTSPSNDATRAINEALRAGWSGPSGSLNGRLPDWYGLVVSDLLLLIEDEPIVYADGTASDNITASSFKAQFLILTQALVIDVRVEKSEHAETRRTTARRRADLERLTVTAGTSVFGDHLGAATWPGNLILELEYTDAAKYQLPLGPSTDWRTTDRVHEILPGLRADLTREKTSDEDE